MSDSAATMLAFALGIAVLAGYAAYLFVQYRRALARTRSAVLKERGVSSPKQAVTTELKPRGPVKTS